MLDNTRRRTHFISDPSSGSGVADQPHLTGLGGAGERRELPQSRFDAPSSLPHQKKTRRVGVEGDGGREEVNRPVRHSLEGCLSGGCVRRPMRTPIRNAGLDRPNSSARTGGAPPSPPHPSAPLHPRASSDSESLFFSFLFFAFFFPCFFKALSAPPRNVCGTRCDDPSPYSAPHRGTSIEYARALPEKKQKRES